MSSNDNESTVVSWKEVVESLCWVPLATVFPAVGFVTGWFAGASQTPVVATLLPLVVGLLSVLSVGLLQRTIVDKRIAEKLAKLDEDFRDRVETALGVPPKPSLRLPAFWAMGVIIFSLTCFWGLRSGVSARWAAPERFEASYPSLKGLLKLGVVVTQAPPQNPPGTDNQNSGGEEETRSGNDGSSADSVKGASEAADQESPGKVEAPSGNGDGAADSDDSTERLFANGTPANELESVFRREYQGLTNEIARIFEAEPDLVRLVWDELRQTRNSPAAAQWREIVKAEAAVTDSSQADAPEDLTPEEMALLHVLYVKCRTARIPGEHLKLIFRDSVNPVLRTEKVGRLDRLRLIVDLLFPASDGGELSSESIDSVRIRSPGLSDVEQKSPNA